MSSPATVVLDIEGTVGPIAFVREVLFPYARSRMPAEFQAMSDADLKDPALKTLQGTIWREGYLSGELTAPVYDDVPPALRRWTAAGRRVLVYSSGSELAQRLYFGHTDHGDLTAQISGWFDTVSAGPKKAPDSYTRIAALTGHAPAELTFLSDSPEELRAADTAGWATVEVVRDVSQGPPWPTTITTFADLPF